MQQAPIRFSQTLWSTFRAAKPVNRSRFNCLESPKSSILLARRWSPAPSISQTHHRYYSNARSDVDEKIKDAKNRIDDSLEARAEAVSEQGKSSLKNEKEETIVHTYPEASSIVYKSGGGAKTASHEAAKSVTDPDSLPSRSTFSQSDLRRRFTDFMDNFQSHVFVASRRLNDLTGYSGIEKLKQEIEKQESTVAETRKAVKETRTNYADTIATRSTTQREVNDLLHRKHTWSPSDLERFTSLYRSDHANEQAEIAAQRHVSEAEAAYEESSVKLARTILARYHEEQIWSDKIRQMSTWGTWGLMGLNVLLFIVFQIAIEPWRRRRLVKGFEEKVELALKERGGTKTLPLVQDVLQPNAAAAITPASENGVHAVADAIVEQIVDAVVGATDPSNESKPTQITTDSTTPAMSTIEAAAETVVTNELSQDSDTASSSLSTDSTNPLSGSNPEAASQPSSSISDPSITTPAPPPTETSSYEDPLTSFPVPHKKSYSEFVAAAFANYEEGFRELFSRSKYVVITHREYTTAILEGFAGGVALTALFLMVAFRGK